VANINEGFSRCTPGDFARYLDFAVGSLAGTEAWLRDGIDRGYFEADACAPALRLKRRSWMAAVRLKQAQHREVERRRQDARTRKKK
jgi:hypothetical protein